MSWKNPLLLSAARTGNVQEAARLLAEGADPNARDEKDRTALRLAVSFGHAEVARLFLEKGADANAPTDHGMTALMWTMTDEGHPDIARLLVEKGADVNRATPDEGATALMFAVAKRLPGLVEALIELGADVNARDRNGRTSLEMSRRCRVAFEILRRAGAEQRPRVLYVDQEYPSWIPDHFNGFKVVREALEKEYDLDCSIGLDSRVVQEVRDSFSTKGYDALLTHVPRRAGSYAESLRLLEEIKLAVDIPIIVYTGASREPGLDASLYRCGVEAIIRKSLNLGNDVARLLAGLRSAMKRRR